jgi:hypothetical protein
MTDTNTQNTTPAANESEMGFTIRQHHGGVRYENLPSHASVETAKGVLATATRRDGGTLLTPPTEGDLVTIGTGRGMTVELKTAERLGYVVRGADGRYVETEIGAKSARQSQAEREDDEATTDPRKDATVPGLSMSDSDADAVRDLTSSLAAYAGPSAAVGAINSIITNPLDLPESIRQLARERGIDETAAHNHVRMVGQAIEAGIGDAVITHGNLSAEQLPSFWQYVMRVHRAQLPSAVAEALLAGDARQFLNMARQYQNEHGYGRGNSKDTEMRDVYGKPVETVAIGGIRTTLEAARRARKI